MPTHAPAGDVDLRPVARGASLRCPACGRGSMTTAWYALTRMRDACPACGIRFEPGRGEWTGALMFAQGFYFGVALLGLFALLLNGAGTGALLLWLLLSAVLFPLATYRNFKGAWVGTMWAARPWQKPETVPG